MLQDEQRSLKARHLVLLVVYKEGPIAALVREHAPQEHTGWDGERYLCCHGCPVTYSGDGGEVKAGWPCATWSTISNET